MLNLSGFGCVIQSRMGSTRLHGKVLKPFCGVPMLQFQIELIQKYKFGFVIVVATTRNKKDIEIVRFCKNNKIKYIAGSEDEVMNILNAISSGDLIEIPIANKNKLYREIIYGGKDEHDVLQSYHDKITADYLNY